ncbi:MAG: Uma2 family endonuclease [Planctomycetes bacterium]|nr:Uma2 family endonuclease [Planctomycetota bacterium]
MPSAAPLLLPSVEEYLAAETDGEVRHEYLGGYLYAMAGAKTVHNRIAMSMLGALHTQLRGQPCEPFNSDMKVRLQMANHTRFYYPDGMVVCSPNGPDDPFQDQPVVIAEVISESTRRTDEGEKREAYLSIASLQVYLLIETGQPRVVAYRRDAEATSSADGFRSEVYSGLEEVVPLGEISAELALSDLYERVKFP